MSPHDIWNVNIIYQPEWWENYVESVLGQFGYTSGDERMMVDVDWVDPDIESDYEGSWDGDTEEESIGSSDTDYSGSGTKDDPIVLDGDD